MKRIFLVALATALTIGSFAADKGKHKKHVKKQSCTVACQKKCDKTDCTPSSSTCCFKH